MATAARAAPSLAFHRRTFERSFRDFLRHVTILSKNTGYTSFQLYDLPGHKGQGVQEYALRSIFDGLDNDVHWFVLLKARQLGITTLSLLLDLFWCAMYPGLQGAICTDTEPNKEKIRLLIIEILKHLPDTHPLPIRVHNRNGLVFENGSMIDYMVAGTKKKPGSLARSRAFNFFHATEVAQWGDEEGLESAISSFSDQYPARLYIFESTAKGYNIFNGLWEDAIADDLAKKAIFLPWWRHPEYRFTTASPLYRRYGHSDLARDEQETSDIVKKMYGYEITREQWAWYRHRKDPQRKKDVDEVDTGKAEIVEVEYPSYPEEAFRLTGSPFLPGRVLDESMKTASKSLYRGYAYHFGESFTAIRREQVYVARIAALKVWHEPHSNGRYIVAADPAYGSGDTSDRFCATVLRCYADRLVQCAEFCVTNMEPYQFTWVIADLCGWYKNARYILEINGPGEAVYTEFRHLQTLLETGRLTAPRNDEVEDEPVDADDSPTAGRRRRRPPSPIATVRDYLYHRADSFGAGYNRHWKTTATNKPAIMTQLGDQFMMGKLIINSVQAIYEMKRLARKGMYIEADGTAKDDRPVALALGVRCWIDWERAEMDGAGMTYEREQLKDAALGENADQPGFMNYIMQQRAQQREAERRQAQRLQRRTRWNW